MPICTCEPGAYRPPNIWAPASLYVHTSYQDPILSEHIAECCGGHRIRKVSIHRQSSSVADTHALMQDACGGKFRSSLDITDGQPADVFM